MDNAVVIEFSKLIHLLGLAMGLGGAIFADLLGLRLLLFPERRSLFAIIDRLHHAISWGLGIVWVSGVALIVLRFSFDEIPNKVFVKYVLVSVITINAIFIGRVVLPFVRTAAAPLAHTLGARHILVLALASSVSIVGWMATLLVAKITALQQMPIFALLGDIALAWVACLAIILAFIVVARALPPAPTKRHRPRTGAEPSVAADIASRARPSDRMHARGWPLAGLFSNIRKSREQARSVREREREEAEFQAEIDRIEKARSGRATEKAASPDAARAKLRSVPPVRREEAPEPRLDSRLSRCDQIEPSTHGPGRIVGRIKPQPVRRQPQAPKQSEKPSVRAAFAACRKALWGVVHISLVTNVLVLAGPLFMLQVYDRVLASGSVPTLTALFAIVACLFVFVGVLEIIRSRILVRVALRADRKLRDAVATSVLRIAAPVGRTRSIVVQDLNQLRQFISSPAPIALFDLPWAPIYFIVIFMFNWILGVIALAGAAILVVLSLLNQALSQRPSIRAAKETEDSIASAEAGGRNAEILHAMGMTDTYLQRWLEAYRHSLRTHTHASDIAGTFYVTTKVTRLFLQSLMLAAGAFLAIQELITPGTMIAASIIMARALAPIEQVAGQWRGFIAARQAVKRISSHIDALPDGEQRAWLPEPQGYLKVDRVYASAPGVAEPMLKGLNFELAPGDALGVVGPSASGKSTLARVLVGVWPTRRGEVRLDGAALHQWRPDQLGRNVGYLAQDIDLFDGTIAENIIRLDPQIDEEKLFAAARTAGVHQLVLNLPDGYNTRIGHGGIELSGGQRQRIALARAVYGDPVFVVLDEPNSNLDQDGDQALAAAITQMRGQGRTVVVFAHKESVLAAVSHLLILSDGRQAAFGPKRDVLSDFLKSRKAKLGLNQTAPVREASDVA